MQDPCEPLAWNRACVQQGRVHVDNIETQRNSALQALDIEARENKQTESRIEDFSAKMG